MRVHKKIKSKKLVIMIIVIIAVLGVGGYFGFQIIQKANQPKTTSRSVTAQSNYTSGDNKTNSSSNDASQGGATDNNGKVSGDQTTIESDWKKSDSGVVILKEPIGGNTIKSGDEFSGTASGLDSVEYRLVDDTAGVIAQGEVSVVNGSFSGNLQFKPRSSSGVFKVYSFNAQGQEINSSEIEVKF